MRINKGIISIVLILLLLMNFTLSNNKSAMADNNVLSEEINNILSDGIIIENNEENIAQGNVNSVVENVSEEEDEISEENTAEDILTLINNTQENINTDDIDLNIKAELLDDEGNEKLEYLTGEEIRTLISLDISGNETIIPGGKLKISFPKHQLAERPLFNRLEGAAEWEITEDDTNWYVVYTYTSLNGGTSIRARILHKMKTMSTSPGTTTTIKWELLKSDDEVIASDEVTYIAKVRPHESYKIVKIEGDNTTYHMSGDSYGYNDNNDGTYTFYSNLDNPANSPNTSTGVDAPTVTYQIGIKNTENFTITYDTNGSYISKTVKIIDKLPEGAVMAGEENAEGKYEYISPRSGKRFEWSYDETNHTAIYEGPLEEVYTGAYAGISVSSEILNGHNVGEAILKLAFPNQPFDMIHLNKAEVIEDYGLDTQIEYTEKSAYIKFNPVNTSNDPYSGEANIEKIWVNRHSAIFSENTASSERPLQFHIGFSANARNILGTQRARTVYIKEIEDFDLDPNLYFKSIQLSDWYGLSDGVRQIDSSVINEAGYYIIGVDSNGEETILGEDLQRGSALAIDDVSRRFNKIKIRFKRPLEMRPNSNGILNLRITFHIFVAVRPEVWNTWTLTDLGNLTNESDEFNNNLKVIYSTIDNPNDIEENTNAVGKYVSPSAQIYAHQGNERYTKIYDGESQIINNFEIVKTSDYYGDVDANNIRHITLIPNTMEFDIENSDINEYTYEIVDDFKGTNKKALIINIGNLAEGVYRKRFKLAIKPTIYTEEGENEVYHYTVWDEKTNLFPIQYYGNSYKIEDDELDLDNNLSTTDKVLKWKHIIEFLPPKELILSKYISPTQNNWKLNADIVDIQNDFYYKIRIDNKGVTDVRNAVILDVLPYIGDKSIVPNSDGNYISRTSQVGIGLVEAIEDNPNNAEFLNKWEIYYSKNSQGRNIEETKTRSFVRKEDIDDFSQVKLLKFVLKDGLFLGQGEKNEVILKSKARNLASFNHLDSSFNSSAVSTNSGNSFIEANKVKISFPIYTVRGISFLDTNRNGIKDETEHVAKGDRVKLMKADSTPARNLRGEPITAIVDNLGNYSLSVYERGDYYIEVEKRNPGDRFTVLGAQDKSIDNHIRQVEGENVGRTDVFTLSPETIYEEIRNIGYEEKELLGSRVIVKYENTQGETIKEDEVLMPANTPIGTAYDADRLRTEKIVRDTREVYYYKEVKADSDEVSGRVKEDEAVITFVYEKAGSVIVGYITEDNETIKDSVINNNNERPGTPYSIVSENKPDRIFTNENRQYRLVAKSVDRRGNIIDGEPNNQSGVILPGETIVVTYVYTLVEPPILPSLPQPPNPSEPQNPGVAQPPNPSEPQNPGVAQPPNPSEPQNPGVAQPPNPSEPQNPGVAQPPNPSEPQNPGVPQPPNPSEPQNPGVPQPPINIWPNTPDTSYRPKKPSGNIPTVIPKVKRPNDFVPSEDVYGSSTSDNINKTNTNRDKNNNEIPKTKDVLELSNYKLLLLFALFTSIFMIKRKKENIK